MSWHFVERWLQKVNQHSTLIGKFWITFLIVFRIVVVSSVGDRVYSDEQSEFKCNTLQVGCPNVCFNKFSPISHIRFWSFQIIMVTTPSIIFIVYSGHKAKKKSQSNKEKSSVSGPTPSPTKKGEGGAAADDDKPKRKKSQMLRPNSLAAPHEAERAKARQSVIQEMFGDDKASFTQHYILYILSVVLRTGVEVLFIFLQYQLFGFHIAELYKCRASPCPNEVDCFVSRPKEKTIFLWFMFVIAAICLGLNIGELYYLIWQFGIRKTKLERRRRRLRRMTGPEAKGMHLADAEILDGGVFNQAAAPPPSYGGAMNIPEIDAIELVPTTGGPGHPIAMSFSLDDAILPDHLIPHKMYPGYGGDFPSQGGSSRSNNPAFPQPVEVTLAEQPYLAPTGNSRKDKGKNDYYDYV
ncbi:gap junction delta-2 protein-like [Clavelina lepadiformis]|uniref:gap junction delta-2 protein-like n=1 Tax=Clavelina lepadiformis TaxID=159417 RepID=UPI0040410389